VLPPFESTPAALRLLADATRLRILALLEREELSVGELSRALDLSQSRVSNHLRLLREAGFLSERHAGTSTHLRLARPRNGSAIAARLWDVLREELAGLPDHAADRVRLEALLEERRAGEGAFFDRMAGEWDKVAGAFATGRARERAAAHLLPPGFVVADLGCGTGYMAASLVGLASHLVCVDRSTAMLDEARRRLEHNTQGTRVEFRRGLLDDLPLADGEVDAVVCAMVFHHLREPGAALAEMRRVLRPGGTACVLELAPHREAWMREELGDRHLGLEPRDVLSAFERAGFQDLLLDPVEDRYRPRRPGQGPEARPGPDGPPELSLYLVRGRAPATVPTTDTRTR
jgi:ArsR family transcriptional regulator